MPGGPTRPGAATASTPRPGIDPARGRSQVVDALRAVAALGVLAFHAQIVAAAAVTPGLARSLGMSLDIGVELFFVLSGLLITGPFIRALVDGAPAPALGRYAVRRVMRILPAYWALLAVLFLTFGLHRAWWEWLVHAVLMQSPIPGEVGRILPVAWTLHVELVFYLLVPCAYLALRRRGPLRAEALAAGIAAVWLASTAFLLIASASTTGDVQKALDRSVPANLGLFCPGLLLVLFSTRAGSATWLARAWHRLLHSPAAAALFGILAVVSIYLSGKENPFLQDMRRPPEALLCWLLVGLALEAGPWLARAARWVAPIGTVSYSLYLWHLPLATKLMAHDLAPGASLGKARLPYAALEVAVVALPAAVVSYLAIERPAMRWSHRVGRTRRASDTEPAVALQGVPVVAALAEPAAAVVPEVP